MVIWNLIWFFTVAWTPIGIEAPVNQWGWHVDRWQPLVEEALEHYGLESELDTFMKVMHCESRGRQNAVNETSGASGLMQHMPRWWDDRAEQAGFAGYSPLNPVANIYTSVWLLQSRGGGWTHWECYNMNND